ESIKWTILGVLRTSDDGTRLAKLRSLDPPADDAALLALTGCAWLSKNPTKAQALLRQALDNEFARPTGDDVNIDFIANILVDLLSDAKKYDDAADIYRREFARGGPKDIHGVPSALLNL